MMYADLDLDPQARVEKFIGLSRELLARLKEGHHNDVSSAAGSRDAVPERPRTKLTTSDDHHTDQVTDLIDVLSELEVQISEQHKLAEPEERVRADERNRLAQYIHDDVGQELAAAIIKLGSVEAALPESVSGIKSFRAEVDAVREILTRIQFALRDLSHDLRPSGLERTGLSDRLRNLLEDIGPVANEQPAIAVRSSPGFPRFRPSVEKLLYRIVMEAVENAVTHANARTITVDLTTHGDVARVIVSDDGVGFDVNDERGHGIGLEGMSMRAEQLGAKLEMVSRKRMGTAVTLSLPIDENLPGEAA